jgi:hypothetical protein
MNLSRIFLGALALSAFTSSGCILFIEPVDPTGDVQYQYAILENDGAGGVLANDCATAGVGFARFAVGDAGADGILDDVEEFEFAVAACNQTGDVNGDLLVDLNEIGEFNGLDFTAATHNNFSLQFLDFNQTPLAWRVVDGAGVLSAAATKFTFPGGLTISADVINVIPFNGDVNQQGDEIQAFFGF